MAAEVRKLNPDRPHPLTGREIEPELREVLDDWEAYANNLERHLRFAEARLRSTRTQLEICRFGRQNNMNECHEARQVARRYFRAINGDECPDLEFTVAELAKYSWLETPAEWEHGEETDG